MKRRLASRLLGQALRSVKWLLGRRDKQNRLMTSRPRDGYPVGQWHRWQAANSRNRRQLAAYRRDSGVRIDPRLADLRRWMVR